MKQKFFAMFAAAVLLLGMTGCSKDDNSSSIDINAMEKDLIGMWVDEFEYSDVTESGVPFDRVLLAIQANADHTGCIYLGVFDDTHKEPLEVYGGPEDAGFRWQLLKDGNVQLSDPKSGERTVLTRGDSGSSYGDDMTNVSGTNMTYTGGNITLTNDIFSGILIRADVEEAAEILKRLVIEKHTDLSMVDCAGNARNSHWTANCYMVHKAGYYKLPLVYGNAIKNGETNAEAYTGVESAHTTLTFPRHDGNAITAPWIKDNGITVATAELLWQDAKGLVTAVGIEGDYMLLTVGKDAATQEGNALVAAKDGDGNIVWSWHIWVTKQTFAAADLATVITGGKDKYNYELKRAIYKLTPVNVGWVGERVSRGYNTYYQWGRKDPFFPTTGTGNTDHPVYNINNEAVTGLTCSTSAATIADNIKNPTTWYKFEKKPNTSTAYNLWDAQQTSNDDELDTPTKKTVYDPCPPGFCLPSTYLYFYFQLSAIVRASTSWDGTYRGRILSSPDVFYPASGCRSLWDARPSEVGGAGYYWSSTAYNGDQGRFLFFSSSSWQRNTRERAIAYSVRAVAEE